MRKGMVVLCLVISGIWWWLSIKINYPPSEEQLTFARNVFGLWTLRIITFSILIVVLRLWYKFLEEKFDKKLAKIFIIVLLISPLIWVSWYIYPLLVVKLVFTSFFALSFFKLKTKKIFLIIAFILISYGFNHFLLKQNSVVINKISLKDAKNEVTTRFNREDSLKDKIDLPFLFRRFVYNKYYLGFRDTISEIVPYFDFETWFFQEVHPNRQKSMVIFFWPEIFLFFYGLVFLKKIKAANFIFFLFVLSLIDFAMTDDLIFKRFVLTIIPLSFVVSIGFWKLAEFYRKKFWAAKLFLPLVTFLVIYGFVANVSDLNFRPDFWLDNRPMAYGYFFNEIKKSNYLEFEKINVTNLIGPTNKYCEYYIHNCDNFVFDSFYFESNEKKETQIYAGFIGEFFKRDERRDWNKTQKNDVESNFGVRILGTSEIRDNIASGFGQTLIVAAKNK